MAPFGSHAFKIAAITAAICTGRQAHEDPSKRWIAGVAAGIFYIFVGVFGVTLAAVFMAFPATFITTLTGLALVGAIGGSLANHLPGSRRQHYVVRYRGGVLGATDWANGLRDAKRSIAAA